jgi:Na+/proline symporter
VVERIEGCKHIICRVCTYEWCWNCGVGCYKSMHICIPIKKSSPNKELSSACSAFLVWTAIVLLFLILLPLIILLVPFLLPCVMMCSTKDNEVLPELGVRTFIKMLCIFIFSIPIFFIYFLPMQLRDRC